MKNAAPVNMMGAVSPAVRETSRMIPVRIPLTALGSTTRRMVCHRVAPMFQQASRKARGTAWSDSRVATMTTGRVMMARVRDAARMLVPKRKKRTKAPTPEESVNDGGNPGQVDDGQVDGPGEPVVRSVFAQVDGRRHPQGHGSHQGHPHQPDGPHQGRENPALRHAVAGHRGKELPGDDAVPLHHQDGEDDDDREHQNERHEQEKDLEEPFHLLVSPIQGGGARTLSVQPLPHAPDHQVGGEVDDEGHDEEEDPQGEEGPVMVGAHRGLPQLGGDGGREGPDRIEDAVGDIDGVTTGHEDRHGLTETPSDTQEHRPQEPVLGRRDHHLHR